MPWSAADSMTSHAKPAAGRLSLPVLCAWLYLVLLPWNVPLRGPLFLHDLLGPVFLLFLLVRGQWREYLRFPRVLLPVFLGLAALATAVHARGGHDLYDLAIMGYMATLFAFFAWVPLKRRHLAWYGALVLGVMWAGAAWEMASGAMRSYGVYEHTTLGFIAKRFFFTFSHPNLTGSFYALPVACLLLGLAGRGQRLNWRELGIGLLALAAVLIPLGLTVSKHMLLSAALIAGAVVIERGHAARWRWLGLAAVLGVFVLFYLTVLFPFFPLQGQFPFFNHATWGMYTTHQSIYWRILFRDFASVLVGVGPERLRDLYPTLADPEYIRSVLDQYQQGSLTQSFCTYMDAHNEYLNTGTGFGLPALMALVGFWISLAIQGMRERKNELLLFFVVALLCCCLWDDLASKRWVWVALGLLVGTARPEREELA
jgi:hypothetical protein